MKRQSDTHRNMRKHGNAIKFDYLNTAAESMIQLCLESLVKSGHMEWQGSLRKTYEKYLLPEVLDLTTEEMWDLACSGKILSLFQMDSIQGKKVMRAINPHSLLQLANTNSLMRLQSKTKEQPIDQYIRYKNDINEWYRDMDDYGLTKDEQEILKEHLLESYGVCAEQEPLMKISMDKRICAFDIVKSNKLRKGIAKFLACWNESFNIIRKQNR